MSGPQKQKSQAATKPKTSKDGPVLSGKLDADFKRKIDDLKKENEALKRREDKAKDDIEAIGKIVKRDFTPTKGSVTDGLTQLKSLIEPLSDNLSTRDTDTSDLDGTTPQTKENDQKKPKVQNSKTASKKYTNKDDLQTCITDVLRENKTMNHNLLLIRKEQKELSEVASSLCCELAYNIDSKKMETPGVVIKETLQIVLEKNRELVKTLDHINKEIVQKSTEKNPKAVNTERYKRGKVDNKKNVTGEQSINMDSTLQEFGANVNKFIKSIDKGQQSESQINQMIEKTVNLCSQNDNLQREGSETDFRIFEKAIHSIKTELGDLRAQKDKLDKENKELQYCIQRVVFFVNNLKEKEVDHGNNDKKDTNTKASTYTKEKKLQDESKIKNRQDKSKTSEESEIQRKHSTVNSVEVEELLNQLENEIHKIQDNCCCHEEVLTYVWKISSEAAEHAKHLTEKGQGAKEKVAFRDDIKFQDKENLSRFNIEIGYILKEFESVVDNRESNHKRQVDDLKKQNEALQLRLSKLAGSKLTEGNPNITNLGDPYRPMKLGETYSELYDNEWTDAMDIMAKHLNRKFKEDTVLKDLFGTITGCYKYCDQKFREKMKTAHGSLQGTIKDLALDTEEHEVVKQVFDRWKLSDVVSDRLLQDLQKQVKDQKQFFDMDMSTFKILSETPFFNKCFKLCWKMVIQDPPLFLDVGPPAGKAYDRNVFREYTSSGTKVVFTVWPALFLHKGGPLLVKGVVKVK